MIYKYLTITILLIAVSSCSFYKIGIVRDVEFEKNAIKMYITTEGLDFNKRVKFGNYYSSCSKNILDFENKSICFSPLEFNFNTNTDNSKNRITISNAEKEIYYKFEFIQYDSLGNKINVRCTLSNQSGYYDFSDNLSISDVHKNKYTITLFSDENKIDIMMPNFKSPSDSSYTIPPELINNIFGVTKVYYSLENKLDGISVNIIQCEISDNTTKTFFNGYIFKNKDNTIAAMIPTAYYFDGRSYDGYFWIKDDLGLSLKLKIAAISTALFLKPKVEEF